jgi:hypothetical protein
VHSAASCVAFDHKLSELSHGDMKAAVAAPAPVHMPAQAVSAGRYPPLLLLPCRWSK